jgi:Arc/MetJ family transcription regulator
VQEQIYVLRRQEAKPILKEFEKWLEKTQPLTPPKGLLGPHRTAGRWHPAHFLLKYTIIIIIMCISIGGDHMGRTNVVIDDDLVNECQKLTGIRTRRALIDYALHEVRRRGRQKRLLELKGTINWEGDLTEWRKARD